MPSHLLVDYLALSSTSSRSAVHAAIQAIVDAPGDAFSADEKIQLVQELLNDLQDSKGRVSQQDSALALLALKTLGRNATASRVIVKQSNLQILHDIANDPREQNLEAAYEALRCVANALLLIDVGRDTWLDINGGELCVEILERSSSPQSAFLVSRILFLVTVKQTQFTRKLVEEMHITDILSQRYDSLMRVLGTQPMAKEALIDILKFTFNLLLQYPRMIDAAKDKDKDKQETSSATSEPRTATPPVRDAWSGGLEKLLPPLLRMFNGLPPTSPAPLTQPLTNVIHALINIPVAPLASSWFSPSPSPSSTPRSTPSDRFHRAISALSPSRRSQSSSRPSSPSPSTAVDVVKRAWDLFETTTAHYVPGDPDDVSVRTLCKSEGVVLDDILAPLVILLVRLAEGDSNAKRRMHEWLLPADLDRTTPLETRENLLGRCIRLMACVYFTRVKDTVGELLFVLCDSDASILAGQIGYGNCAGFLFNKGIMAPPPEATAADGTPINPITGVQAQERPNPADEMTQEEREREAERLFVLFDRLERSGMGINPIRQAQREGRLEEIS